MIEIEVEMDSDVLAAEATSNAVSASSYSYNLTTHTVTIPCSFLFFLSAVCKFPHMPSVNYVQESITEQINQAMEIENLAEAWVSLIAIYFLIKYYIFCRNEASGFYFPLSEYMQEWRIQAEANDEVERLLRSQPISTEHV